MVGQAVRLIGPILSLVLATAALQLITSLVLGMIVFASGVISISLVAHDGDPWSRKQVAAATQDMALARRQRRVLLDGIKRLADGRRAPSTPLRRTRFSRKLLRAA